MRIPLHANSVCNRPRQPDPPHRLATVAAAVAVATLMLFSIGGTTAYADDGGSSGDHRSSQAHGDHGHRDRGKKGGQGDQGGQGGQGDQGGQNASRGDGGPAPQGGSGDPGAARGGGSGQGGKHHAGGQSGKHGSQNGSNGRGRQAQAAPAPAAAPAPIPAPAPPAAPIPPPPPAPSAAAGPTLSPLFSAAVRGGVQTATGGLPSSLRGGLTPFTGPAIAGLSLGPSSGGAAGAGGALRVPRRATGSGGAPAGRIRAGAGAGRAGPVPPAGSLPDGGGGLGLVVQPTPPVTVIPVLGLPPSLPGLGDTSRGVPLWATVLGMLAILVLVAGISVRGARAGRRGR